MAKGGRFLKQKTPVPKMKKDAAVSDNGECNESVPQKNSAGKIVLIVLAVILAVLVILGAIVWFVAQSWMSALSRPSNTPGGMTDAEIEAMIGTFGTEGPEETIAENAASETTEPYSDGNYGETGKIINILIIGQDSREDENHKNSDTIILASLNKQTKVLTLNSFLRDSYVKLADYGSHRCGKTKINFAYALGYQWGGDEGAFEMINNTLINNFDATIDHDIEVSLNAFTEIIDCLGGIDVDLSEDEANYMRNDNNLKGQPYEVYSRFVEGSNHLNGIEALSYARMRHANYGDNDYNRTARQRNVITQVVEKCRNMGISELTEIVKRVLPNITTDMTNKEITTYILEVLPVLPKLEIVSQQIPIAGTFSGKIIELNGIEQSVQDIYNYQANRNAVISACTGVPVEELEAKNGGTIVKQAAVAQKKTTATTAATTADTTAATTAPTTAPTTAATTAPTTEATTATTAATTAATEAPVTPPADNGGNTSGGGDSGSGSSGESGNSENS